MSISLRCSSTVAAQIVDAVDMVRMGMRVDHRIKFADAGGQHLRAKIRPGVDDDARHAAVFGDPLDHRRSSRAAVFRIGRIAIAPIAGDARRAGRRAAAQNREAQPVATDQASSSAGRGILLNSRKKFSVVISDDFVDAYADRFGQNLGCMGDIGRFVALAAKRDRREIWRIGFDQQPVVRHLGRDRAQFVGILESQYAGKRDIAAEPHAGRGQVPARRKNSAE